MDDKNKQAKFLMPDFDVNLLEDESVISAKPKDEAQDGSTRDSDPTM